VQTQKKKPDPAQNLRNHEASAARLTVFCLFLVILLGSCTTLAVRPEVSEFYRRSEWKHWSDPDGNCRNTRAEILIRSSVLPVHFKDKRMCDVISGHWVCPYSGRILTDSREVQIDHIVPLAEAHRSGGWRWNAKQKEEFANDPLNLLPVDGLINRSKRDKDPARWLPEPACPYIRRWVAVKKKYRLYADRNEMDAIKRSRCL